MTDRPSPTRRRIMTGLGLAAVAGWVWGAPRLPGLFAGNLDLTPINNAPGFDMLGGTAQLSLAGGLFAGLDAAEPEVTAQMDFVRNDPCAALYGAMPAGVPVALFSDFNCPNCPAMDANVAAVLAQTPGTSLHRHELPLLGQTSQVASRAVLAADLQGQYGAMHSALLRTPAVTDLAFIRTAATRAGLDAERLLADMARPEIAQALAISKALAAYLGLYGTPATVIGRTVMLGTKPQSTISAVIAHEMKKGQTCT